MRSIPMRCVARANQLVLTSLCRRMHEHQSGRRNSIGMCLVWRYEGNSCWPPLRLTDGRLCFLRSPHGSLCARVCKCNLSFQLECVYVSNDDQFNRKCKDLRCALAQAICRTAPCRRARRTRNVAWRATPSCSASAMCVATRATRVLAPLVRPPSLVRASAWTTAT